jgi:tagatose-6-phosphate ketose/aldose isomerase
VDDARFLDITCNADGELARRGAGRADTCTLLMPSASCDRAFAMTSSLTCMLLAALTVFDRSPWDARVARLKQIAALAREGQAQWDAPVARWRSARSTASSTSAAARWKRWHASALKVLELTAGRVLALANTPLGFRHGPKSTLDGNTLVVVLRSVQPLARRYEQDLLEELRRDGVAAGAGDRPAFGHRRR